jgi:hypothetical protein
MPGILNVSTAADLAGINLSVGKQLETLQGNATLMLNASKDALSAEAAKQVQDLRGEVEDLRGRVNEMAGWLKEGHLYGGGFTIMNMACSTGNSHKGGDCSCPDNFEGFNVASFIPIQNFAVIIQVCQKSMSSLLNSTRPLAALV